MNPWDLSASDLLVWGIVLHLIADWPLQNDWMANNKMKRWLYNGLDKNEMPVIAKNHWWLRHPAAHVHATIHMACLALVFGYAAALLALAHLIIDCRWVVVKWSRLMGQTQPDGRQVIPSGHPFSLGAPVHDWKRYPFVTAVDIGMFVRFMTDQVFHIACIAVAALLVTL